MRPIPNPALPTLAALLALASSGCARATRAAPAAVALPPPTPMQLCLHCGRISAMLPGDIPRWRFTVQMDDGTEELVFQDKAPWLQVGVPVRIEGGRMVPR